MSSDQVIALVSIIAGAIVGGLGIWAAVVSGTRDRAAARKLVEDERRQDRLDVTYRDLIIYLARRQEQVRAVRPFMGAPTARDLEPGEIDRISAAVTAHASAEVWDLLTTFHQVAAGIRGADIALTGMEGESKDTGRVPDAAVWGASQSDFLKRIFEDKARLTQIEDEIHERIRVELGTGQRSAAALEAPSV